MLATPLGYSRLFIKMSILYSISYTPYYIWLVQLLEENRETQICHFPNRTSCYTNHFSKVWFYFKKYLSHISWFFIKRKSPKGKTSGSCNDTVWVKHVTHPVFNFISSNTGHTDRETELTIFSESWQKEFNSLLVRLFYGNYIIYYIYINYITT